MNDNLKGDDNKDGYARWWKYPSNEAQLRGYIDAAFDSRETLGDLVENGRELRKNNASCS